MDRGINYTSSLLKILLLLQLILFAFTKPVFANDVKTIFVVYSSFTTTNQKLINELKLLNQDGLFKIHHGDMDDFTESQVEHIDLIIASGTHATLSVLKKDLKTPVLSVLIPKIGFDQAVELSESLDKIKTKKLSAIYFDQPVERQAKLAKLIMPNISNVGIILGEHSKKSLANQYTGLDNLKRIQSKIRKHGVSATLTTITSQQDLIPSLKPILSNSDVVVSVIDPLVFNRSNIQTILIASYRHRVPLIGISKSYLKAGAVASVHSTPKHVAKEIYETISVFNRDKLNRPSYPKYFSVEINKKVARSYNIRISNISYIHKQMGVE